MKKRCIVCKKLTPYWQQVNSGPVHCYDGCKHTTGVDNRIKSKKK